MNTTEKIEVAKELNPELVLFRKDERSNRWILAISPQWYKGIEYFACLPQHNEDGQCLHWLNGGDVEYKVDGCAVILGVYRKWAPASAFMDSGCEITKVIVEDEATNPSVDNPPGQTFESEKHNMPDGATHYRKYAMPQLVDWLKLNIGEPAYIYREGHGWELFTPTSAEVIINMDDVTPIPQDEYKNGEWLKYCDRPVLCRYVCFDAALNLHLIDTDDSLIHVSGDDISRPDPDDVERVMAAKSLFNSMRGRFGTGLHDEFENLSPGEKLDWISIVVITGFKL